MRITDYFKRFLNGNGYSAFVRQFGTELSNLKVENDELDGAKTIEDFNSLQLCQLKNGGVAGGTTGNTNQMLTDKGNLFEYHVKGTQTILVPAKDASGLNICFDATENDGIEFTQGIQAGAKHAYVAGTDRFYLECILKLALVAGMDDLAVGFRKAEAYQAAIDNYDEGMFLNIISGNIKIETILNNGSTSTTDTTDDVTNAYYAKLRLEYDDRVGLSSAIDLAKELKALYNLHINDTARHTTGADVTNTVTVADAYDLTTLIALVTQQLTKYVLHDDDAEKTSAWSYHAAQEAADHSVASASAPTTLPECIARLNDMKTKLDAHNADNTAHGGTTPTYQSVNPKASSATFKAIAATTEAGVATAIAPTVTAPFTFDDAEVVVPFIYFLHDSTPMASLYWRKWECGKIA